MTPVTGPSRLLRLGALSSVLLGWSAALAAPPHEDVPHRDVTVADVLDAWRADSRTAGPIRVTWRHAENEGPHRFSRFLSEWASAEGEPPLETESILQVDGERFRLEAAGFLPNEHEEVSGKLRQHVPLLVRTHLPERFQESWLFHRQDFFRQAGVEARPVRRFVRTFDGATLQDFWPPAKGSYPRATVYERTAGDWLAWREGLPSADVTERLLFVDLLAALLAVDPAQGRVVDVDPQRWSIAEERRRLGDQECVVLESVGGEASGPVRSLWIAPDQGMRIRRYFERGSEGSIQIDLEYESKPEFGWTPRRWSVIAWQPPGDVIQSFLTSTVAELERAEPLDRSSLQTTYPAGTWVIDRDSKRQYLTREDGSKRPITGGELLWLPTYAELRQTESGKAGELIEATIKRGQFLGQAIVPGAIGGLTVLLGLAAWVRRLRRSEVGQAPA